MVRGEAHLIFRDVNTGEITRELTETNYVTESMLNRMCAPGYDSNDYGGADYGRFGQYIFIGGLQQEHDRGWDQMWEVYERGTTESGVLSPVRLRGPVGTGGTDAYYFQWQQRFSPPGSDRDIYTIGINNETFVDVQPYNRPIYVSAYVVLSTPCTQTTTETLDIFYRVIFDNPEENTSNTVPSVGMMDYITRRHHCQFSADNLDTYARYPYNSIFFAHGRKFVPHSRNQYMYDGARGTGDFDGTAGDALSGRAYGDTSFRTRIMYLQGGLTNTLGMIIGTAAHTATRSIGEDSYPTQFFNPIKPANESPIQNTFSHSASATGPFYSAASVPTGDGTLTVNGDAWTDPDYHKLLRIQITGTGGVGAGTYKVWQRNITGFIDNTYSDNYVALPFVNNNNSYFGLFPDSNSEGGYWYGAAYHQFAGAHAISYDDVSTFVGFRYNSLSKHNILTNERTGWSPTTSVPINLTDISQVMVADSGDIWVADAGTGLHRIHADEVTIEQFDNTHTDLTGISSSACYGVTKTPGRIWAIMHDSLIYTTDNGATFTVYNSGSTPAFNKAPVGEELRYWFLQGDPTHADHRLAIGYNDGTLSNRNRYCDLRIVWWDSVSGEGNTTGYINSTGADTNYANTYPQRRRDLFEFFHCSPNDNIWGSRRVYQTSGADDDAAGIWNYNGTSPVQTFSGVDGDENTRSNFKFWWTKDDAGNDAMALIQRYAGSDHRYVIFKQDGTHDFSSPVNRTTTPLAIRSDSAGNMAYGAKVLFPESGMFVFTGRTGTSGQWSWYMIPFCDMNTSDSGAYKQIIWKEYGWDGANWVLDHPGSKTIHATDEALIDGLTVSFDDNGGAQTFVDTEYYTVGVVDGVWMDGGTEFDSRYALYYKPVDFNRTEIEGGGLLPATTSSATRYLDESEISAMTFASNVTYDEPSNRWYGNSGSPWYFRFGGVHTDHSVLQFRFIDINSTRRFVCGYSVSSKSGTAPSETNIDYGVRATEISDGNYKVEVFENGTVVSTLDSPTLGQGSHTGKFNQQNDDYAYYRFTRKAGTTDLELRVRNQIVHTWTGVTDDLMPTFWGSSNGGYLYWSTTATSYDDYHVELGDSGSNVGLFDPNFFAIDNTIAGRMELDEIRINGVAVTNRLINDYGRTALAAGEIDLLPTQGKIRFSPADVGKTLTIDRYNVILHE